MDALVYLLRDFFVFLFENTLEPLGDLPNAAFLLMLFVGLFVWLRWQGKYNGEATAEPVMGGEQYYDLVKNNPQEAERLMNPTQIK